MRGRMDRAMVAGGGAVLGLLGLAWADGVRINVTPSMPVGLWRVSSPSDLRRGDVVTFCAPRTAAGRLGHDRGYLGLGNCEDGTRAIVKTVVAVAGDRVEAAAAGLRVNGEAVRHTELLTEDTAGRALLGMTPGSYAVAAGEVWVASGHDPRSWDSRYWGALPTTNISARARSLWVMP